MKVIKNTYIDNKISELIQRIEKRILAENTTNIYNNFNELIFKGSYFIFEIDLTNKECNFIVNSEQKAEQVIKLITNEETIKITNDLTDYIEFLKTKEKYNR